LKADFIASLPYAAERLRLFIYFERFEGRILVVGVRWIRPENVITSSSREKRARRDPVRPLQLELKKISIEKEFLWNFFLREDSCARGAVRYPTLRRIYVS
jgi:hypothetical protein